MAIISFNALPAEFDELTRNLGNILKIDGPLSGDDGTILAQSTRQYSTALSEDGIQWTHIDLLLEGSFTYGVLGTVAGTVTSITLTIEGAPFATITEVDGDASIIWAEMMGGRAPLLTMLGGDDDITGTKFKDTLHGFAGDDVIRGRAGLDTIYGDAGDDWLYGGAKQDYIKGGVGQDHIFGETGNDYLYGGGGNDVLRGGDGHDYVGGGTGADRLFGGIGRDSVSGGDGRDRLDGGMGQDRLHGGAGKDILIGGSGNDYLDSGDGDDTMTGGAGEDRFIFSTFGDDNASGADVITDFEVGDTIYLGRIGGLDAVEVTQTGDDVVITLSDAAVTNSITLLNALEVEVSAALTTAYVY